MKKVLIINPSLNAGGAEKVLINILNNLNEKEMDITLLLMFKEGIYLKNIPNNIKLRYLFKTQNRFMRKVIYKIFKVVSPKRLYKMLQTNELYDVEIAFLEGICTKIIAGSSNKNSKKVAWVHTDFSNNNWTEKFYFNYNQEKACYEKYNKIIFVSNESKKGFSKKYNICNELEVIYNPIEPKEIIKKSKQKEINFNTKTICSVGRLIPEKGFDRLIKAHAKLYNEGLKHQLVIIGEGRERNSLEKLINKLKVQNSVKLLGFKENPFVYVRAADIYISSSRVEGFPLVIAEALILGKAVISTRCSGPNEILDDGKYGFLVENSEEGIYDGLKVFLKEPANLQCYSKLALQRKAFFDIDNIMKKIINVINS